MANISLINDAKDCDLNHIKLICFDIDETFTTRGKLTASAYQALWNLHDAGFYLMPITGRSAAWCDHFARFWPINAVIGENGAFAFFMDGGVRRRLDTLGAQAIEAQNKIEKLKVAVKEKFPFAQFASDQNYREYDLAIDVCEDVQPWKKSDVDNLLKYLKAQGAIAKLSSVHVNAWFGDYDKCSGIDYYLTHGHPGISEDISKDEIIFIGDSPNDCPMFETFKCSVGVANIMDFADDLSHLPTFITHSKSGDGFCEFSAKMVEIKNRFHANF